MAACGTNDLGWARGMTTTFLAIVVAGRSFVSLPLLTVFLKYLGLSAMEAGLVASAQATVEMLAAPVWLWAVRRVTLRRRALVVLTLILAAALHVCLVFVPPIDPQVFFFGIKQQEIWYATRAASVTNRLHTCIPEWPNRRR
jgi:hypothetical protein